MHVTYLRVFVVCLLVTSATAAVHVTVNEETARGVLELPQLGVVFSYPKGWQVGQQDDQVHVLFKPNFAQVNIRFFQFSADGMPLHTFVERVTQTMTPPYTLKKDHGIQRLGGTTFHVHDLQKEGGGRANWSAWFTITDTNHGLWILCEYGGVSSRKEVLQIINSLRRPGEPDPLDAASDDSGEATDDGEADETNTPPAEQQPPAAEDLADEPVATDEPVAADETPAPQSPESDPPLKKEPQPAAIAEVQSDLEPASEGTPSQPSQEQGAKKADGAYRVFGTHTDTGSFKGMVFRSNLRDRTALPVYIAFWPAGPDPQPILSATDDRGRYTVDLPEGTYTAELYNAEGVVWQLLKGEGEFKSRGRSGLHHFKINNDEQ